MLAKARAIGVWAKWGLALVAGVLLVSCAGPRDVGRRGESAAGEVAKPEWVEGGREMSPSRRASEARPLPWDEEQDPFAADRLGVQAYRAKKRAREEAKKRAVRNEAARRPIEASALKPPDPALPLPWSEAESR